MTEDRGHPTRSRGLDPTFRWGNPMRERRRSAAMSLHDRPVAPVRLRFPIEPRGRHTAHPHVSLLGTSSTAADALRIECVTVRGVVRLAT